MKKIVLSVLVVSALVSLSGCCTRVVYVPPPVRYPAMVPPPYIPAVGQPPAPTCTMPDGSVWIWNGTAGRWYQSRQ